MLISFLSRGWVVDYPLVFAWKFVVGALFLRSLFCALWRNGFLLLVLHLFAYLVPFKHQFVQLKLRSVAPLYVCASVYPNGVIKADAEQTLAVRSGFCYSEEALLFLTAFGLFLAMYTYNTCYKKYISFNICFVYINLLQ